MRWLFIVLAGILLSGCAVATGSSSGSGDAIPQRDANDLATVRALAGLDNVTPTPRRARPTATATRPAATATTGVPTKNTGLVSDDIYLDTLLMPADISTNWTYGDFGGLLDASFCDAASIDETFTSVGWAYGSYSATGGQWAEQWVLRLTESDAQAAMEYARTSLTCDEYSLDTGAGGISYWALSPVDLPLHGDDIHAVRATVTWKNPAYSPYEGTIVFARKGEYIVVLWHYGFRIDRMLSARMVEVAVARLDLVADNSV